jgi:hypothetical protein
VKRIDEPGAQSLPKTQNATPDRTADFFIFFARNPLKSPDSEKLMKGNESKFAFISFHGLAFIYAGSHRQVASAGGEPGDPAHAASTVSAGV